MFGTTCEFPATRGRQLTERLATIPVVALRIYLASIWLRFAHAKFASGWLTMNPLRPLLSSVAKGQIPTTAPGYHVIARMLVASHADALLSIAIPCAELLVGCALMFGIAPRITAFVATALNVNLLLSGVGTLGLDGRMIVLQLIFVALLTIFAPLSMAEIARAVSMELMP